MLKLAMSTEGNTRHITNAVRIIVAGLLLSITASAEDPAALVSRATAEYQAKHYAAAAKLMQEAIDAGAKNPSVFYNAACYFALDGRTEEAFKYLDLATSRGFRDLETMKADKDLETLHGDARWRATLKQCEDAERNFMKTIQKPELRAELLKRMKEDQDVRLSLQSGQDMEKIHRMEAIDKENTAWIKGVIEKDGWPGKSLVGDDGALAVFLLVQHADRDVDFQEQCLDLMKAAAEKGEARKDHVAYLTDRVLVARGKKQLYGTQFIQSGDGFGPQPIEDEAHVDDRRKALGLPPLAEYAKSMGATYQPPKQAATSQP